MTVNVINPGWLEPTVRLLIGLPTAMAYFYVRHLSTNWAYFFLGVGLAIMATGLLGRDKKTDRKKGVSNVQRHVIQQLTF